MKSILLISCVFPPEPTISGQVVMDIANELSHFQNVNVISPKPSRPLNYKFPTTTEKYNFNHIIADSFIHPQSNTFGRFKESYSFGKWCEKYIEKHHKNIDVIYHNSWPLFSQYFIIRVAKKYQIPCITHIQDIYPDSFANKIPLLGSVIYRILLPIDKYILKNSGKIICVSDNMRNILQKTRNIKEDKFFIIQNWQNEEQFIKYEENKVDTQVAGKPFTFMYLGNNGPVAGVELLIESFVDAGIPNSELIIAGSGSRTSACKELAVKFGAENIRFISVPEGKVPETQDLADVMLLPVKTGAAMSSIPSKLPAYMFSKKAIIGSLDLESDTARAIRDSGCGILVEPEDKEKLSKAMGEISKWDKEKLSQCGEKGFDYAMEHLSKQSNLKKLVKSLLNP